MPSIYILRHEIRGKEATYDSLLTARGMSNAVALTPRLAKLDIRTIYCSPFLRAIQTIHPYATKYNIPINIDYSLLEFIETSEILPSIYWMQLVNDDLSYWNINDNYQSVTNHKHLSIGDGRTETNTDVRYRANTFLQFLRSHFNHQKGNILVVSHKTLLCHLWDLVHKKKRNLEMGEIDCLLK